MTSICTTKCGEEMGWSELTKVHHIWSKRYKWATYNYSALGGVSTREKHGNRPSTLDLTLATPSISRQIVSCEVDRDTIGSDHLPVITTLKLAHEICRKPTTRWNFKMLNSELVEHGAMAIKAELHNLQLNTLTEVDYYCHQLVQKNTTSSRGNSTCCKSNDICQTLVE